MKTTRDDIKLRFCALERKHIADWDKAHPRPAPPHITTVMRELRQGKARANARSLAKALQNTEDDYRTMAFLDVITTPSIQQYSAAVKSWRDARAKYVSRLDEAKNCYLDRVLFDHESAFLLINDFKNWNRQAPALSVIRKPTHKAA